MRNQRRIAPTFSLQQLLLFGVGIAVLCGLRRFTLAMLISVFVAIYYVCLGIGSSLTRKRDNQVVSPFPILELRDKTTIPALVTTILCNLVAYLVWFFLNAYPGANPQFFFAPIVGGLSLYALQQLTLVLLHVALLLTYFGNCWNATSVDAAECRTTAIFSCLLTISHIAQPWAVDRLLALNFWLWSQMALPLPE